MELIAQLFQPNVIVNVFICALAGADSTTAARHPSRNDLERFCTFHLFVKSLRPAILVLCISCPHVLLGSPMSAPSFNAMSSEDVLN